MNKQILKEMLKQAGKYILSYFTQFLWPVIQNALNQTKEYFINILWDSVKDQFADIAKSTVEFIERFFDSPDYKEKEKAIIDTLFQNVDLPILLKPFKPILKKVLKGKVRKLIGKYIKKLDAKF